MNKRKTISCHKGLAPISVPEDWLMGFDINHSFANVDGEGRIRFPNGRAFGVSLKHNGPKVTSIVRELSTDEIDKTNWGSFGPPWENEGFWPSFKHGKITELE